MHAPLSLLLSAFVFGRVDSAPWEAFADTIGGLIGFKDASGKVRIPARFFVPTSATVFRNVVAVNEWDSVSQQANNYFLRKDGSTFGHDSVPFLPDFRFPCEEEGRILFTDARGRRPEFADSADRLGYFDSTGKVVVPARFVDAGDFHAGFAEVIEEGYRACLDGRRWSRRDGCEHWYWHGEGALIDRQGRVVARPFSVDRERVPDWSRARVVDDEPDTNRIRVPLLDGRILSIPDPSRDFQSWFSRELPSWKGPGIRSDLFFPKVYSSNKDRWNLSPHPNIPHSAWSEIPAARFLAKNRARFAALLDTFRRHPDQVRFSAREEPLFAERAGMLDGCGRFDRLRFPAVEATWDPGDNVSRRELLFVRTPAGYKIIEVH